jgi:hypothetical protein
MVGVISLGVEHAADGTILRRSFPPQIRKVRAERRSLCPVPDNACLDGNVARSICHEPGGRDARRPAAAECSGATASPSSRVEAAGLLDCRQRLSDERLGPTAAAAPPVADASKSDAEVIVADHSADLREVRVIVKCQGAMRIGRLSCDGAPRAM